MSIRRFTIAERPANEAGRQAALDSYGVAAEPHPDLDKIVAEAAAAFDVPTALVSLIDRDRQWFPARVGLEAAETPRSVSFCSHAIHQEGPFVVPDATADPRFAGNPLVVGEANIRFYAGAPLITPEGYRIGTLCIIGTVPRKPLDVIEQQQLTRYAGEVMSVLEQRRKR